MQNNFTYHDELIAKYLDCEEISEQEKKRLLEWIQASDENRAYFEQTAKAWEKSIIEFQDKTLILLRLEHYKKKANKIKKLSLLKWTISVAAVVVIVFAGLFLFQSDFLLNSKMLTVSSGTTKQEVLLPDGSSVWLSAETTLKYPSKFKRKREVWLNGEAYFDVIKDKNKPFSVHTENITINVKGTSFYLSDHSEIAITEVVLETGIIDLTVNSLKKTIGMKPNQKMVYDIKTGELSLDEVNASNYTTWKEDRLVLENTLLQDAFVQLEKWYNVEIECTNQKLLNTPVSFTIDTEELDVALELIQYITNATWKKTTDNKILIQ